VLICVPFILNMLHETNIRLAMLVQECFSEWIYIEIFAMLVTVSYICTHPLVICAWLQISDCYRYEIESMQ
jgi:hypothetical protein